MTRLLNTQLQHIKVRYSKYDNRNISLIPLIRHYTDDDGDIVGMVDDSFNGITIIFTQGWRAYDY